MGTPVFLRRCLRHKVQEKQNKRIQMTVCLKKVFNNGKSVFPMYVCLARRAPNSGVSMDTVVYQIGRIFIFRNSREVDWNSEVQVKFTLPELNKLAKEAKSDTIDLLFVSAATVEDSSLSNGANSNSSPLDPNHLPLGESGEYCLLAKATLESIYMAWNHLPTFRLGNRTEICTTLDLFPCILKSDFQNQGEKVSIQRPSDDKNMSISEMHISISAEEFGSKEKYSRPFLHL
ncbi:polycomb group protein EMBRYONIC FLOWER 2-like [Vigna umbellata]|uniref:polycomb group protein EMBRYONIC FLOWER 2-like n=1 Tax=Vigna umbellata TaxID=87088 RepID=UPI001F5EC1CB|nr:polycomb group protein EMBRYONIC FLOWER 2-like [Vigna umbellata]